jgi:hypothetical protein
VRLLYESKPRRPRDTSVPAGQYLHTPVGRVIAGILLAQGLAYGLQLLCTAGLLATAEDGQESVWSTLYGLVLLQTLQALSLLVAGAMAGAGQRRAFLVGAVVGVVHGFLFLLIQDLNGEPLTEVALYGQPLLHLAFGMVGAVVGASIWRPLPTVAMPEFEADRKAEGRESRPAWTALHGPIAWGRVAAGVLSVTGAFLFGPGLLTVLLDASGGTIKVNDHLQAQLVTWEIVGLLTLFGAAFAGATTRNGLKQGLCVGIGTCVVLVGNQLGGKGVQPELVIYTVGSVLGLTIAGGWFGGQLFPPVRATMRRRGLGSAA